MWSFTISSWLSNLVLLFIFHNQLSENHKVTQTKYSTIVSAATQWMWRRHRGQESQLLTCQRCFTLLRLVKYGPSNMVLQVQLSSPVPKAMKTLEFIKGKAVVLNLKYIFTAISSYHGPPLAAGWWAPQWMAATRWGLLSSMWKNHVPYHLE